MDSILHGVDVRNVFNIEIKETAPEKESSFTRTSITNESQHSLHVAKIDTAIFSAVAIPENEKNEAKPAAPVTKEEEPIDFGNAELKVFHIRNKKNAEKDGQEAKSVVLNEKSKEIGIRRLRTFGGECCVEQGSFESPDKQQLRLKSGKAQRYNDPEATIGDYLDFSFEAKSMENEQGQIVVESFHLETDSDYTSQKKLLEKTDESSKRESVNKEGNIGKIEETRTGNLGESEKKRAGIMNNGRTIDMLHYRQMSKDYVSGKFGDKKEEEAFESGVDNGDIDNLINSISRKIEGKPYYSLNSSLFIFPSPINKIF